MVMKLRGLMTMDMFVYTRIHGIQIIPNNTKASKYFVGIFYSWIALPTKYTKLNAQYIKMISQYLLREIER